MVFDPAPSQRRGPRLPHGRAADLALAGVVFTVVALGSVQSFWDEGERSGPVLALAALLLVLACGVLYFRRRYPVAVGWTVLVLTGTFYSLRFDGPLVIALIVALYTAAAMGRMRAAVALVSVVVFGVGTVSVLGSEDLTGLAVFLLSGWLVAVVALGYVRYSRLAHAREVERRAATEERLRIARELHDVIGHHISLINVQAGAALHRLRKDPAKAAAQAEEALAAVKDSSKAALRELRATLGVLRQADEAAPLAPAGGLDRLGELLRAAERAGLAVRTRTEGAKRPLSTEVGLAAYRITQESLTNVARHAHATAVTVRLRYGDRDLLVEVEDDGNGTAAHSGAGTTGPSTGSGLGGMRERARALGGELIAGPRPGGGFAVQARIPYGPYVPGHPDGPQVSRENGAGRRP
ncbi:sensor histidine kinase [Streptomyces sp. NPDC058424]|uniref:sensor histidine kinase n=1 Tax=Streptomyces sp. NPDC058424 TaxID=3346491 RepID=UPI00364685C9